MRIARLARELGCGDFVKIEIMRDTKYLLPDKLFEVVYVSLISQAQLKGIVNGVVDDNDEISFEKAKQVIDAAITQNYVAGSGLLGEFARAMKYYGL